MTTFCDGLHERIKESGIHDNTPMFWFSLPDTDALFPTPGSMSEGLGWEGKQINSLLDRLILNLRSSNEENTLKKCGEVSQELKGEVRARGLSVTAN